VIKCIIIKRLKLIKIVILLLMNLEKNDYKTYFYEKFVSSFKELVLTCKNKSSYSDVDKIISLFDKLNYEKILQKVISNTQLQENLHFLNKNNFDNDLLNKLFSKNEKSWTLIPSLSLYKVLNTVSVHEDKQLLYKQFQTLHVSAVSYNKVIEAMNTNGTDKGADNFNPFVSVGTVDNNMDIQTLFNGVECKNMSAIEMVMENFVSEQMDSKMSNYMENIKEDDVNSAANKINEALNSDQFKSSNNKSSAVLTDMLGQIKSEVIDIGKAQSKNKNNGKKSVEQLLGIAQKVASNMMGKIQDEQIDVMDLWNTTSNLAQKTTNSDAIKYVDALIRNNIQKSMSENKNNENNENKNSNP